MFSDYHVIYNLPYFCPLQQSQRRHSFTPNPTFLCVDPSVLGHRDHIALSPSKEFCCESLRILALSIYTNALFLQQTLLPGDNRL